MPRDSTRLRLLFGSLLFLAAGALSSCGPTEQHEDIPTITPEDAGNDTGPCGPEKTMCDGECVDLQVSFDHCGRCGNSCGRGDLNCVGGTCECIVDENTNCNHACVDTTSNPDHCGMCGNACAKNEKCADGTCKTKTHIEKVIEETNKLRSMGYDCHAGYMSSTHDLEGNEELHKAAQRHAEDMAENQYFSHDSPEDCDSKPDVECKDFGDRIGQTDYSGQPVGENIARGQDSAQSVVQSWATSKEGHCRNMMNPDATEIGVGRAESSGPRGPYWVQVFGRQ